MPTETPVEVSIEELQAKVLMLEAKSLADDTEKLELGKSLKDALDLIEGDTKAKLIPEIMARTDWRLDELVNESIERLRQIRDDTKKVSTRKLTAGVDMTKLADDVYEPLHNLYGKWNK